MNNGLKNYARGNELFRVYSYFIDYGKPNTFAGKECHTRPRIEGKTLHDGNKKGMQPGEVRMVLFAREEMHMKYRIWISHIV